MEKPLTVGKYTRFTATPQPERYRPRVQNACMGLSAEQIASLCQVNVATARRWKRGATPVPYCAAMILLGDLGVFGKHWSGWAINGENLISPDNWAVSRNTALSVPLQEALLKARDGRIRELEAEVAYLKSVHALQDQPEPDQQLTLIG